MCTFLANNTVDGRKCLSNYFFGYLWSSGYPWREAVQFCPPVVIWAVGNVWKHLRLQWGKERVATGGEYCWPLAGKTRDAAKHLTMYRTVPTITYYVTPNVNSARIEKPCCKISFLYIVNNSASNLDDTIKAT